jgi:hypothetical protein
LAPRIGLVQQHISWVPDKYPKKFTKINIKHRLPIMSANSTKKHISA